MPRTPPAGRGGFTLVELLVVMSLIIVLAGLTVAVAESGAFGSQKVISGADRASGWLLIAKQRAIRDQRPRGVRFLLTQPDPTGNPTLFAAREAQFIEVPDSFVPDRTKPVGQRAFLAYVYQQSAAGGPLFSDTWITQASYGRSTATPNGRRVFAVFPSPADYAEFSQRVFPGSLLTLPGTGATYRIDQILGPVPLSYAGTMVQGVDLVLGQNTANVGPPYFPTPTTAPLPPAFTYPDFGTAFSPAPVASPPQVTAVEYNFAFTAGFSSGATGTGGPQPLVGEPVLQLTGQSIVIDVRPANTTFSPITLPGPTVVAPTTAGVSPVPTAAPQYFDVLFSPSGQVLGAGDGLICLWLRDGDKTTDPRPAGAFDQAGEQVLVTVYTRTGLIATHPVTNGADPFVAAKDGLNSGL